MGNKYYEKALQIIQIADGSGCVINRLETGAFGSAGFEAMQNFTLQIFKMLFVANGGALGALMTLVGALSGKNSPVCFDSVKWPMIFFGGGLFATIWAVFFAMRAQKFYNKPILRNETLGNILEVGANLKKGSRNRLWSGVCAFYGGIAFGLGCCFGIYSFVMR